MEMRLTWRGVEGVVAVAARVFLKAAKSSRGQCGRRDLVDVGCAVAIGSACLGAIDRYPRLQLCLAAKRRVVSFPARSNG